MTWTLRATMNLAAGAAVGGALLLGVLWSADRAHRWERPHWRPQDFVPLRAVPRGPSPVEGRWVIAVNPRCPHCMAALSRVHAAWQRRGWHGDLVALIVDAPRRPGAAALRAIPSAQVWWDRGGIWRRRWGHRRYGEVIQFDGSGRPLRTVMADDLLHGRGPPAAEEAHAPANERKGGL